MQAIICSILAFSLNKALAAPTAGPKSIANIQRRDNAQDAGAAAAATNALYILTNDEQNNAVAAISMNEDGTLKEASITETSGQGGIAVDADGQPAVPDALVGQSALTVVGQMVFAVNAGSNTVSMLTISPDDPLSLQMVGEPATLPGTFPNTVAASMTNSLVCVGMTGSQAGISCGSFDAEQGIGEMDDLRPFDIGQSDPPAGPTNTVSQTFFSEDETMLLTTVKGDPEADNVGFLSAFAVETNGDGAATLSTEETKSSPDGTAVLFGSEPILGTNPPQIFATDASFGGAILEVDMDSMEASLLANQSIEGQSATCWVAISDITGTAFVTDVGVNRIVEMSLEDASIVAEIDLREVEASSQDPGLIDLRTAGGLVYALSPGDGMIEAAISVVDVQSKKLVQHARLGLTGVGATAMGMAVLSS